MSSYLQAEAREENLVDLKDLQLSGRFQKADPDGKRLEKCSSVGLWARESRSRVAATAAGKNGVGPWH